MKEFLGKIKSGTLIGSVLFILLGIMLIVKPGISFDILCVCIGLGFIVFSVVNIVAKLKVPGIGGLLLFGDIMIGLAGVYFVSAPNLIKGFIPIVLGIVMLYHAVTDIRAALLLKAMGERYVISMVIGIITLVISLFVLLNPFGTGDLMIRLVGVAFLYDGVSGLGVKLSYANKKQSHDNAKTVDYREL